MTADNLPALRTPTALAVIPAPDTTPRQAHSTSGTLFGLAALAAVLGGFAPLSADPTTTAVGMGVTAATAAALGIRERRKEVNP